MGPGLVFPTDKDVTESVGHRRTVHERIDLGESRSKDEV